MAKQYWLMKSEPDVYSIDDLETEKSAHWDGVRNYQARNFMRDQMGVGDLVLFYHSNAKPPGVAGVARVVKEGYPDHTAWDPKSKYFDPKSPEDAPRWFMVDVRYVRKLKRTVTLRELKHHEPLSGMRLLQRGNRLSIMPVTEEEWNYILELEKEAPES